MADTKISQLPEATSINQTDILPVVIDTGSGLENRKIKVENLLVKATGAEVNAGTNDSKIVTPKALADSLGWVTATDGATIAFDLSLGNKHKVVLGGNRTLAVSNVKNGQAFIIKLTQDATGGRTVTWWSGISWVDGVEPVLTTTPNKSDVFGFIQTGTNTYDGFIVGLNI